MFMNQEHAGQKLAIYQNARMAKNSDYDGKFYVAVLTTGIFCRPSCPAPTPKEQNVRYFEQAYQAMEAGFRPCLRCRPDLKLPFVVKGLHPEGALKVQRALEKIHQGFLNNHLVSDLAQRVYVSERQLRHLFDLHLGVSPKQIAQYHRVMFAHQLVRQTEVPMTQVAFASGFQSVRQFNSAFQAAFERTPSQLRTGQPRKPAAAHLVIPYPENFSFQGVLGFMASREIKAIERVSHNAYERNFRFDSGEGRFRITDDPIRQALLVEAETNDVRCYMALQARIRTLFDLDADLHSITRQLAQDPCLSAGLETLQTANGTIKTVPRLPVAFDVFEFVVRAILGQVVSVKAATTLANRLVESAADQLNPAQGEASNFPVFPTPAQIGGLSLDGLGMSQSKQKTIFAVAQAVQDGWLSLSSEQSYEAFYRDFITIKGIGEWTVNYVAMRGLGMKQAFPAGDLGVLNVLAKQLGKDKMTPKQAEKMAEKWQPYAAYAALCLWNQYE